MTGVVSKSMNGNNSCSITWDEYLQSIDFDFCKVFRNTEVDSTLKSLIRKFGIPSELRGELWFRLSGADIQYKENMLAYTDIVETKGHEDNNATPQIEKDLKRTFPDNVWFRHEDFQNKLRNVLCAYSWINPEVGYCQSMNFWTAMCLLFMPEEHSFWVLCKVVENMLPRDYFTRSMHGVLVDVIVLKGLLSEKLPKVSYILEKNLIDINAFVPGWFLCLFINVLPLETSLVFLDCFFCEGDKMLFRAGLALFKIAEKKLIENADNPEVLFNIMRDLPQLADDPQQFLKHCFDPLYLTTLGYSHIFDLRADARITVDRQEVINAEKRREFLIKKNRRAAMRSGHSPISHDNLNSFVEEGGLSQTADEAAPYIGYIPKTHRAILREGFQNHVIVEDYRADVQNTSKKSRMKMLTEGQMFTIYNETNDKNRFVYLVVNIQNRKLEWSEVIDLTIPETCENVIKWKAIASINCGMAVIKCEEQFENITPEELSMAISIVHRHGELTIIAPSKQVYLTWLKGLKSLIM
eukprot:TRINITY_DN6770_c0_g1_i1.p1 TRINITY_DN6770_c0_g1~~TRINITY_DN6770_c0_g1_i1.p1  ORF type:complete len:581 (-),score=102.09 TRINITY_DN6770_c0_g1_i1:39-1610(-)